MTQTVNEKIDLAVKIFDNEEHLVSAFDCLQDNDNAKLACAYLLMACESHERKA